MPRFPRLKAAPPESSIAVRALTLAAVLIAVGAVAIHDEFRAQAVAAAWGIVAGFATSYLRRHHRNLPIKAAISLLVLVVARDFFITLAANPYDPRIPLVRLFLWLQTLHSFDLPARKDLKYSLASAVVLMAVGAVFARDAAFGLLLIPFAVAASAAIAAMVASQHGVRVGRPVLRAGAGLALAVLVAAALVFALMPRGEGLRVRWTPVSPRLQFTLRLHGRIFNPAYPEGARPSDPAVGPPLFNPEGYIGFSTLVDLRLRGVLTHAVVMRVRTTRPGFWRGLAFDEYTGLGWRMTDPSIQEYSSDQPRIVPRFDVDEPWPVGSEQVVQTFYIEAPQPNVFFAAYRASELFVPTGTLGVDRYAGLRSPVPLEEGTIYSVISRVPAPGPLLLRRPQGRVPESIRARYLQLPSTVPGRVRALAHELTKDRNTVYDRVIAVNLFLTQQYAYNLDAPSLPHGADAVDHFLFDSRQGSCETFASAMAVLLRAAGIPARLVTGYTTGTYNLFTGYYEVRNSDAHAWVEVYLPGAGWIEFEPTPGFLGPEEIAARPATQWLAGDAAMWVLSSAKRAAAPLARLLGRLGSGLPVTAGVGLGFLLAAAAAGRGYRRRTAGAEGIIDLYAQMTGLLARRGYVRRAEVTPREFLAAVPREVRTPVALITHAFEEVRYGGRDQPAEGDVAARDALAAIGASLRARGRPNGRRG